MTHQMACQNRQVAHNSLLGNRQSTQHSRPASLPPCPALLDSLDHKPMQVRLQGECVSPALLLRTVAMVVVGAAAAAVGMGVLRRLPPLASVLRTACLVSGSSSTTPSGDPASTSLFLLAAEAGLGHAGQAETAFSLSSPRQCQSVEAALAFHWYLLTDESTGNMLMAIEYCYGHYDLLKWLIQAL